MGLKNPGLPCDSLRRALLILLSEGLGFRGPIWELPDPRIGTS